MTERQAKYIATQVAKMMMPRIKKIVNEAVKSSVKDIVYESVVQGSNRPKHTKYDTENMQDDWDDELDEVMDLSKKQKRPNKIAESKEELARRASLRGKAKAAQQMESMGMDPNDSINSLILDTEDPEMEQNIQEHVDIREAGKIKASQLSKGDVIEPSAVDYSEMIADL
jgi:hypothetical protein